MITRTVVNGKRMIEVDYVSEALKRPITVDGNRLFLDASNRKGGEEWFGVAGEKEARELMRVGWPEGAKKALDAMRLLRVPKVGHVRRLRWGWDGVLDEQKVINYEFEPFSERRKEPKRVVTVSVDICDAFSVPASALFWRGAATLAVIRVLEGAGFSVRVTALANARGTLVGSTDTMHIRMIVKRPTDPMNVSMVAGALCCTSAFRLGVFHLLAAEPEFINGHFGYPTEPPEEWKGDIHISKMYEQKQAQDVLNKLPSMTKGQLTRRR